MHRERQTQDVIVRLLTNIGSRKEVERYLKHYASVDAPKFAVLYVSGRVMEQSLDTLASSMSFLRRVGLVPIVVHGGGEPSTRQSLHEANLRLVEALEALDTRARPFTSGLLEAEFVEDKERHGSRVTHVREGALEQTARAGMLPIVAPLGETPRGQIVVLEPEAVACALARALKPYKIVFLSESGGLTDESGTLRSAVNLAEDDDTLDGETALDAPSRAILDRLRGLLDDLPPTSSASVTSPEHLAKELFTHGGDGTLVRRGERVGRYNDWRDIDTSRVRMLLEECFGRRLDPKYFDDKAPYRIYLADSYRAIAILTLEGGVPYLDKFAVTSEAQGEGIGGSMWQRMRGDTPKVFWRSRANNPINPWYAQKADGLFKASPWWVFWNGMESFSEIERSVTRALAMPATFHEALATEVEP
jgi:acetylglutamate synthase